MKKRLLDYNLKIRLPIIVFVMIAAFAITYYVARPERDGIGYGPEQPIEFSHQLHAGKMEIDCQYCHTDVAKSRHASIPSANVCMNCHSVARKDKEEIIKLTEYYEQGEPIPWKRIHKVPDYVYFDHSRHVNVGIECETCHYDIQRMEVVRQIESFTMGACLDCHRDPASKQPDLKGKLDPGPTNCNTCHR